MLVSKFEYFCLNRKKLQVYSFKIELPLIIIIYANVVASGNIGSSYDKSLLKTIDKLISP